MAYPIINSRRMPYDIDGTVVGLGTGNDYSSGALQRIMDQGIKSWLSQQATQNLNSAARPQTWPISNAGLHVFWFFFPELREVEKLGFHYTGSIAKSLAEFSVQGSNDTSNGIDGTWENAIFVPAPITSRTDQWRQYTFDVSFSGPIKTLRIGRRTNVGANSESSLTGIHLYGRKAAGQLPHDLLFCELDESEKVALMEWGDRPEGTTVVDAFKLKNASLSKIAHGVNLQLNDEDFLMSFAADGPWTATLDIPSIAPNSVSAPIYIRHQLAPPNLVLGPRQARVIATIASWS